MMGVAESLRDDVVALYVDPRGPYPRLVRDWYDADRDAKTYDGPLPVVAHPPCGPWGALKHLNRFQDASCAPRAAEQVRQWGGVLEHPHGSGLFAHAAIPAPGDLPDPWGGVTIEVCQVDWGHVARKRTWLYIVGARALPPVPPPREPTHWVSGGRQPRKGRTGGLVPPGIKVCSAEQRRRTPVAVAEWLIEVASRCAKSDPLRSTQATERKDK
jgi:hypothetical protein